MADSSRWSGGSAWLDAVLYDQDEPLVESLDLNPIEMGGQAMHGQDDREAPGR